MIKKIAFSLLAVASMALLPSCNSDSNDGGNGENASIMRFVTLTSNTDNGSSFGYTAEDDKNYSLTSTRKIPDQSIKVGNRLIIGYTCNWGAADKSGAIDLMSYRPVINGSLEVGSIAITTTPQYRVYPSMSGEYLNIQAQASIVSQPKTYKVVLDETTENSNWPTVWLIFESDKGDGAIGDIYASFDMSAIWKNNQYQGYTLKTVVTSYTGSLNTWNFAKPGEATITPAN